MKDAFATLGFERRPFIDPVKLQERYLEQAILLHPDQPGGNAHAFVELGAARDLLEDPAGRLYHLIRLQGESIGTETMAASETEEMMDLASLLIDVKQHIAQFQGSITPLVKATLIQPGLGYLNRLEKAQERIQLILKRLEKEIQTIDQLWPHIPLSQLAGLATSLRFVQKRRTQISELLFQLKNTL